MPFMSRWSYVIQSFTLQASVSQSIDSIFASSFLTSLRNACVCLRCSHAAGLLPIRLRLSEPNSNPAGMLVKVQTPPASLQGSEVSFFCQQGAQSGE